MVVVTVVDKHFIICTSDASFLHYTTYSLQRGDSISKLQNSVFFVTVADVVVVATSGLLVTENSKLELHKELRID